MRLYLIYKKDKEINLKIKLYTTHCPQCTQLSSMLDRKNINYEEITDISTMHEKGINRVPILEVDGVLMDYKTAYNWVKNK